MPFCWGMYGSGAAEQGSAIGGKRGKSKRRAANKRAAATRRRNR